MSSPNLCPVCGGALAASAPEGLCPKCLWASLLSPEAEDAADEPALSTGASAAPAAPEDSLGALGDYELLGEIARGGMGVVYRARQISLQRVVALKMIRTVRLPGEADMKRFRAEAEAVAGLEHPNIVPIYEVGEGDVRPYFTMKLVPGGSLADRLAHKSRCDACRNSPTARSDGGCADAQRTAGFIAKVARAVHHAHQRGILHRDLKPSNILLDERDEPLVTDFGLAKDLEADRELTLTGAVLGTPAYIAPEQAAGSKGLTTAADVYSLGAILYEMLTGQPPFRADTPLETLRQVMEQEPLSPSSIHGQADRDLETVCLKCLQKDPARRYGSAEALAEDLERWLRREPIQARRTSAWEKGLMWARRHKALTAFLLLALIAPVVIIAVLLVTDQKVRQERSAALESERKANLAARRAKAATKDALEAKERTHRTLYAADMLLADQALDQGNLALARTLVEAYRPTEAELSPDLIGFEWRYLWKQCQGAYLHALEGQSNAINCLGFSPDGKRLASADADGTIRVWDVDKRTVQASWSGLSGSLRRLRYSPDGNTLVVGSEEGTVDVLNVEEKQYLWTFRGHTPVRFLFTGNEIAVYDNPLPKTAMSNVKVFDWMRARETRSWPGLGDLEDVSPDGKVLVLSRAHPPVVELRNAGTGERLAILTNVPCNFLALSPDGQTIAVCGYQARELQLVKVHDQTSRVALQGHTGSINGLAFSPDSRLLVTASTDQSMRIWDVAQGREKARLLGHVDAVMDVGFSPDGRVIATAGKDRRVLFWPADYEPPRSVIISNVWPPLVLSPNGRILAARSGEGDKKNIALCDLHTRRRLELPESSDLIPEFFSADNGILFARGPVRSETLVPITRWDLAVPVLQAETTMLRLDSTNQVYGGTASPDGRYYAVNQVGVTTITLWNPLTGKVERQLEDHSVAWGLGSTLGFSPDGQKVVSLMWPNYLRLSSRSGFNNVTLTNVSRGIINHLVFSPDGTTIALASPDHTIRIWDASTFREVGVLSGHQQSVYCLAFSPDGRTLASCGGGGELKLWCWPARREVVALQDEGGPELHYVAFTSDGSTLLAGTWDGCVRVWRAPSLAEIDRQR